MSTTNQSIALINGQDNVVVTSWLFHELDRRYEELRARSSGGGRGGLSKTILEDVPLHLPPVWEQAQIACILDTTDEAIRKTEQLITKLQQMKRGLLHDLLTRGIDENGELRDPERHPEHFLDSSLGRIPQSWKVLQLIDVAAVMNGTTPPRARSEYWTDGTIPWLSSGRVNDYIVRAPSAFITEQAMADCGLHLFPKNTVIVGMIGQGRTRGMSARLEIDATINQNLAAVVPGPRLQGSFLHSYLDLHYEDLRAGGRGSNQDALNCTLVAAFPILVPPIDEQTQIAQVLATLDGRIDSERASCEVLRSVKTGLMSDLLTGRVRTVGLDTSATA